MSELAGMIIADRYEVANLIAQGGQALICRARDRRTGHNVAVKLLTSAHAQNPEFVRRLAREQEIMIALAGTNAVAVLDLCLAPSGAPCLVMELLEGEDLEDRLSVVERRRERIPLDRIFEIFDPIVDTLQHAHSAGILHRDLKPANVYLLSAAAGGGVRLLDFGFSSMKTAERLTAVGTVVGSPSYIAPEIWNGQLDQLDRRADVYSLAVILFRVLGGRLPFEGETLQDKLHLATRADRPSLHALRPDLPRGLDAWVERALAIDREQRFPSVRALWSGLWAALHYTPRARPRIPVAASVVSAWRGAAATFRRVMVESANAIQRTKKQATQPTSRPPKPIEVNAEWLLDGDALDLKEPTDELDFEKLLEDAPAPPPRKDRGTSERKAKRPRNPRSK